MKTSQTANWLVASFMLAAHIASAETWYLKTANNGGNLTTPSHWTNSVGTVATAFSADDAYVVAPNKECKTPNSETTFAGGELCLGTGGTYGQLNIYCTPLLFPLLTLDYGTLAMQGANGGAMSIDGEISVVGQYNVMRWLYSRQTMTLAAKLKGESTATLSTNVRYANNGSRRVIKSA